MSGYDDGRVQLTDDEIILRHYYLMGPKHIPYSAIRRVIRSPLRSMGRIRIHGSGDLVHWFNFDPGRPRKNTALVLYLDGRIRPVLTPDDPDAVVAELTAHGVSVTAGFEGGLR